MGEQCVEMRLEWDPQMTGGSSTQFSITAFPRVVFVILTSPETATYPNLCLEPPTLIGTSLLLLISPLKFAFYSNGLRGVLQSADSPTSDHWVPDSLLPPLLTQLRFHDSLWSSSFWVSLLPLDSAGEGPGLFFFVCFCFNIYLFTIYLAAPGLSCGTWGLVPWSGIEPAPPPLGAQILSHWTPREASNPALVKLCCFSVLTPRSWAFLKTNKQPQVCRLNWRTKISNNP